MKDKDKNLEFDFENQKIGRPFTTPDSFFQNLEDQILNQTVYLGIEKSQNRKLVIMWSRYIAAAVIAISLFTSVLFLISKNNQDKENNLIVKTEDQNGNIQSDSIQLINKPDIVDNNLQQHDSEAISNDLDNSQKKSNSIGLEIKNQKIQKPGESYNLALTHKNQISNESNLGQIQYNQSLPNSPFYSQHISDGNGLPTLNGADIARISNGRLEKLISLPSDTCSVNPVILTAIKNNSKTDDFLFLWSTGESTPSIKIYESGEYSVKLFARNRKVCLDSATVAFNKIEYPQPDLGLDQTICSHEGITLFANTNHDSYKYKWSYDGSTSNKLFINRLPAGEHRIKVSVEACGTVVSDEVIIYVNECILQFSNVITPNGDGKNDFFVVGGLENYPGSQLYIMDRNGKIVFESLNYQNNWSGEQLIEGTYFYFLKLNDGKNTEKGGSVTIIRK